MRSMSELAFSSPSALTSTRRTNSSPPTPSAVWLSSSVVNVLSTLRTSSRVTLVSSAMERPRRCTSFAPMCLRISAASVSPSVSNRMAARSTPPRLLATSGIARHPRFHDLRSALRILRDHAARRCYLLFVGERGRFRWRFATRHGQRRLPQYRRARGGQQSLGQRLEHAEHDDQQHEQPGEHLRESLRTGSLPDGNRLELALLDRRRTEERRVHDVDRVPARTVETHGIAHQRGEPVELI